MSICVTWGFPGLTPPRIQTVVNGAGAGARRAGRRRSAGTGARATLELGTADASGGDAQGGGGRGSWEVVFVGKKITSMMTMSHWHYSFLMGRMRVMMMMIIMMNLMITMFTIHHTLDHSMLIDMNDMMLVIRTAMILRPYLLDTELLFTMLTIYPYRWTPTTHGNMKVLIPRNMGCIP